jgi:outer membrane protein assembly factor BamB
VSPDGTTVYVTGESVSVGSTGGKAFATVAYDSSTGAVRWVKRYAGAPNSDNQANALEASPDGTKVFVTGQGTGSTYYDYVTVAYDAKTGATLWAKRYNNWPDDSQFSDDRATALSVSPDGSRVFVTGESFGGPTCPSCLTTGPDYATVAYNASTGAPLWAQRYHGYSNYSDQAYAVGVSPDGTKVYVTGDSTSLAGDGDYYTLAYAAATGAVVWTQRFDGPGGGTDSAYALAVGVDGSVYVTGISYGSTATTWDYATVAYDGLTGARKWTKRYNGTASGRDQANAIGVSPDGTKVFATGQSLGTYGGYDFATVGYSASTGARLWTKRYNGPVNGDDYARSLDVTSSAVFVTGQSYADWATAAYAGS